MAHPALKISSDTDDVTIDDREKLLQAIVELCESAGGAKSNQAQEQLEAIFLGLVSAAEKVIRERLAVRLATAAWAPRGLVNALAHDEISVARPVIASSPVLKDFDLIAVLAAGALEHQIEVARRPAISAAVVTAIIDAADPVVLTALANNVTAEIDDFTMGRFVALAERVAAIRGPLCRHPRLSQDLATALYAWVGRALRMQIAERFQVDGAAIDAAVRAAVDETMAPLPTLSATTLPSPSKGDAEAILIAKMQAAGELRPGFLLRALRQGNLTLFLMALASLGNVPFEAVRVAVDAQGPEGLALLCGIVGIDRSVFPNILSFVRALNQSRPATGPDGLKAAAAVVTGKTQAEMMSDFKAFVGKHDEETPLLGRA